MRIWPVLKPLVLSLVLLGTAALALLLSDWHSREGARRGDPAGEGARRVALLKHASNTLLDDVERGVLEALAGAGYAEGGRLRLQRFNAEGDLPTANAMASRIVDGSFEMGISISTLSLQCLANANRDGRVIHVFGGVTDPAGAGVGIQAMGTTNKPPWLAGLGTFQPVEQILQEARRMWPGLRVVGVVWNPAERNSEACTLKAREVCRALGLQLLEAHVEASKDVREAAESLVARGVQAFWTGADVTVLNATAALCDTARKARIPVFSNTSGHVREGTLFDLGANYTEVGRALGEMAASILDGRPAATVVITNFMPERVMLNHQVRAGLRDPWVFPPDMIERAELVVGEDGRVVKETASAAPKAGAQPTAAGGAKAVGRGAAWQIRQMVYVESAMVEEAMHGLAAGLKEAGLVAGEDYHLHTLSAQGDMATLGALFDSAVAAGTDLYVVYGTPTLQTALRKVPTKPVVFTVVADPFIAGAGRTDTDHLPNVTGVYTLGPYREMAELLRDHFPRVRRVGTLFCPAEANSVANKDLFVREATRCGLEVEAVPANSPAELPDAALALCSRRLDAVVQIIDNLSAAGFPTIARAATLAGLPVFSCQGPAVKQGAAVALARDYFDAGRETAALAARILRGEDPARLPFAPPAKTRKLVNLENAAASRLEIPRALLDQLEPVASRP